MSDHSEPDISSSVKQNEMQRPAVPVCPGPPDSRIPLHVPLEPSSIESLLKKLSNGSESKGASALEEVSRQSPEMRYQITKHLFWVYDQKVIEKPMNAYIWLLPILGSCSSSFFIVLLPMIFPIVLILLLVGSGGYIWDQRRKRTLTRQHLEILLLETEDVRLLPIALTFPRSAKGQAIALEECVRVRSILLRRLLPQVREEYTHVWTPEQTAMINHLLRNPFRDGELTLALLRVAVFVGNQETLNVVERLIRRTEPKDALHTPVEIDRHTFERFYDRIHAAAMSCHEGLRARLRPLEQAYTLLRASTAPAVSAKELLRPVDSDANLTPQGELLRAYTPPTDAELELHYDVSPAAPEMQQIQRDQRETG